MRDCVESMRSQVATRERRRVLPRLVILCSLLLAFAPTAAFSEKKDRGAPGTPERDAYCERKLRECTDGIAETCMEEHRGDVDGGTDCIYEGFLGCYALYDRDSRCRKIPRTLPGSTRSGAGVGVRRSGPARPSTAAGCVPDCAARCTGSRQVAAACAGRCVVRCSSGPDDATRARRPAATVGPIRVGNEGAGDDCRSRCRGKCTGLSSAERRVCHHRCDLTCNGSGVQAAPGLAPVKPQGEPEAPDLRMRKVVPGARLK